MRQRSNRLQAAIDALWSTMAEEYGLLPDLAFDAVVARADRGEWSEASPRLLQLLIEQELSIPDAVTVVDRSRINAEVGPTRPLVEEVFDAWWQQTLMIEPGQHDEGYGPDVVLGILVGYGAPMVRWFEPWLIELDGPGAAHLAKIVLDGLDGPAWHGKADQAGQVLGWARTETVVHGLALIGGTHLDDEVLSDVLDRLIL